MVGRQIRRLRQRGLTLVELLVVIVILALASSVVLLNAPPSRPETRDEAERFAARLSLAFDRSIATGESLRLTIDAKGYAFERLKDDEWAPLEDAPALLRKEFKKRTTALVEIKDAANDNSQALGGDQEEEEEAEKGLTRIALDPLGGQTAFQMKFSDPDGAASVVVTESASVSVNDGV